MTENAKTLTAAAFLLAGVALIAWFSASGDALAVLQKAINICLECVGIG